MPIRLLVASFRRHLLVGSISVAFLAVSLLNTWATIDCRGEDRPRELPKDGAWARYQVQNDIAGERDTTASVTLSLVGTIVEDGVPCRWLETKMVIAEPPAKAGTFVNKILVPEADLLDREKPFEHVRRRWFGRRDEPPRLLAADSWENIEELLLWTPGMLKGSEAAKNESKDIDYQRGKFENAQARTGEIVYKRLRPRPPQEDIELKLVRKYTVWRHPGLPLGFVEARIASERFLGPMPAGRFSTIYRLQDMGTDARSELPDSN
jgi:hypothetical protein